MPGGPSFDSDVRKALVTLAIEDSLLEISQKVFDKVANQLKKDYNCYIPDCYSHPEYLQDVLKKRYNEYYDQIISQIEKKLEEFSNQKPIEKFLKRLSGRQPPTFGTADVSKHFVRLVIERVLLEMGMPELEQVKLRLKYDYNCELADCLDHPEYLKKILCDLFGDFYDDILVSIRKTLEKLQMDGKVEKFLIVLEGK